MPLDQGGNPAADRSAVQSLSSAGQELALDVDGCGTALIDISGSFTGVTLGFFVRGPVTEETAQFVRQHSNDVFVTSTTVGGLYIVDCAGFREVVVKMVAHSTGSALVHIRGSEAQHGVRIVGPIPTGNNVIGQVGINPALNSVNIQDTRWRSLLAPVNSTGAVYQSGDNIGGLLSMTGALRNGLSVTHLEWALVTDKAHNTAVAYEIHLFKENPVNSTFTDGSPQSVAEADAEKLIGVVRIPQPFLGGGGVSIQYAFCDNINLQTDDANGTIWAAILTRQSINWASGTDNLRVLLIGRQH